MAIPKFGKIWGQQMKGLKFKGNASANHLAVCTKASAAFSIFFQQLIANYTLASFMAGGTVVIGTASTPLAGKIAGFSPLTVIRPLTPAEISSKFKDKSKPFWVNFYSCFDDIFKTSVINIDCKTGGFPTPMVVQISMLPYVDAATTFYNELKAKKINKHKDFLDALDSAVDTLFKTKINSVVNYSGVGAGTYTATVTITFAV